MAYRNSQKKTWNGNGKMSDSRVAWVGCVLGTFELRMHLPNDAEYNDEEASRLDKDNQIGPNLRLGITQPGKYKPLSLNLTAMTLDEITALRSMLDLAFDLAEPVVKERDRVARDAKAAGDDSYVRSYRRLPEVVVRESKIFTYSEGVLFRPDGLPVGAGPDGDDSGSEHRGGTRGSGHGMADEEPEVSGTKDDGTQTD